MYMRLGIDLLVIGLTLEATLVVAFGTGICDVHVPLWGYPGSLPA
jgi:hypothetical protein